MKVLAKERADDTIIREALERKSFESGLYDKRKAVDFDMRKIRVAVAGGGASGMTAAIAAARAGADFYRDFYSGLTEKLACKRALPAPPPEGVEACLREKNGESYVFLQNFSGEAQSVPLPEGCVDMASGQAIATAELAAYDSVVIKRG